MKQSLVFPANADHFDGFEDDRVFFHSDFIVLLHLPNVTRDQGFDLEFDVFL